MASTRDFVFALFLGSALVVSWWLMRSLRARHAQVWEELERPGWMDLLWLSRKGRATVRFVWSGRLSRSGDWRLVLPGWLFRLVMILLISSGLYLLFPELHKFWR